MATWFLGTKSTQAVKKRGATHADYIAGVGAFADKDEVAFCGDFNLPEWAEDGRDFFDQADAFERANGRSFRAIVVAIPNEAQDPVAWSKNYAREVAENHAHRLAVHLPTNNPHLHLMLSERGNRPDLPPARYFSRANPKAREMNGGDWLEKIKTLYEQHIRKIVPYFNRPTRPNFVKVGQAKGATTLAEQVKQEVARDANKRIQKLQDDLATINRMEQKMERREDTRKHSESLLDAIRPKPKTIQPAPPEIAQEPTEIKPAHTPDVPQKPRRGRKSGL
ncbi:MobA/MobL family protein [Ferriphaselus sp. R-1]|uniref:MobA/MobL family protein n=1 Tax=Ferriphaselus sp. R-1 TaxID=1485544 RepID=UPI00054EA0B8|nr:MobA/MobL family protein [Ferriphaselus sp. R-1]